MSIGFILLLVINVLLFINYIDDLTILLIEYLANSMPRLIWLIH